MRLYLVQHGQALAKEVDPQRPLSDDGQADIARLASFLSSAGIPGPRVVHSGKKRAQQTAELLAAALAPRCSAQAHPGLDPHDPPEELAAHLAACSEDTMVVGHLPFLARLAMHLVGGAHEELISFRPGTALCLERMESSRWSLAWMIPPELLRR